MGEVEDAITLTKVREVMVRLVDANTMRGLDTIMGFREGCLAVMADCQANTMRGKDKLGHNGSTTT